MAKDIAKTDIYQTGASEIVEETMEKMSELEFDHLEPRTLNNQCVHQRIVKLFYAGMHSNYGCTDCKKKTLDLKEFD